MEKINEALKALEVTLERYRKNKTMVSPEDLAGKYKVPFQKLKDQLKSDAEKYLVSYCFQGFIVKHEDSKEFLGACDKDWIAMNGPKEAGRAIFKEFDIGKLNGIADKHKANIQKRWEEYFNRHVCLYAYGQCFADDNPHNPLIYNDLVDKFWDEPTGKWIDREKPQGDAILIFVGGKKDGKENDSCSSSTNS